MIDVVPNAGVIALGKQGENQAVRVTLPNIRAGAGSILLLHQRSDDQKPYPVPVVEADGGIIWTVSSTDTAYPGRGQAELQWLGADGAVIKSVTYQTNTIRALTAPGAVPDEPLKPYTQAVARAAQAAKNAAASATEAARSAEASAGQAGLSADNAAKSLKKLEDGIASGEFHGQDGKSAYQLAVDAGFDGTETQWLESLKGAPGDTTAADAAAAAARKSAEDAQKNATAAQAAAQEAQEAAETAVLYTAQNLTGSQQEQARTNINAADKARQNVLVGTETGNPISVDDAFSAPLCGLTVYGKSTQDGTPTPDAPVPIVSAGDGGSIAVTLNDENRKTQTITLPTSNGLLGIPAAHGGNYTDQNGQQWVCDEVDFERGVYVKRIGKRTITSKDTFNKSGLSTDDVNYFSLANLSVHAGLPGMKNVLMSNCFVAGIHQNFKAVGKIFLGSPSNDKVYFSVDAQKYQDTETFKQWAVENGLMFLYQLTDIMETHLTAEELAAYKALRIYSPTTTITNDAGAGLKLEYQRDVNIVVKNLEDAIASMTTA